MLSRVSIFIFCCSLTIPAAGFGEEPALDSLVAQLTSESFRTRVSAQQQLSDLAADHLDQIEAQTLEATPEVAQRLISLLEAVFLKHADQTGEAAEQALMRIAQSGTAGGVAAGRVLQGNSLLRESRARQALEKLGAQFVYYKPLAHYNGQALFISQLAVIPEVGVGFGPPAVLRSIYLHENWTGTKDDLWHLQRLSHHRDLVIYLIKGSSIEINDLFQLAAQLKGLSIQERGACLGIRSQPFASGCVVGHVVENGAADRGGLLMDDEVLALDEIPIRSFQHLVLSLQDYSIGDEVTFTIKRNGEISELIITLGSWRDVTRNDDMTVDTPPLFLGPLEKQTEPESKSSPEDAKSDSDSAEPESLNGLD